MDNSLINIKDSSFTSDWRWSNFLSYTESAFSGIDLHPYSIPSKFSKNESYIGSNSRKVKVKLYTIGFQSKQIRQARIACIDGAYNTSVMNFVISPFSKFNAPFFGADFVTLPNGHLIAIDLQPVLKSDLAHTTKVWERLKPIYNKWSNLLPGGGPIPNSAKQYFSAGFLWTRIPLGAEGDQLIFNVLAPAYKDYLSLYLDILGDAEEVDSNYSLELLKGQKEYMNYRSEKDPARGMLTRFFGKDWTESYISKVLFNL